MIKVTVDPKAFFFKWVQQFLLQVTVLGFGYYHCLHLCLYVSLCVSVWCVNHFACPRNNSGPVQARIAKFGPEMQKTLVKFPI